MNTNTPYVKTYKPETGEVANPITVENPFINDGGDPREIRRGVSRYSFDPVKGKMVIQRKVKSCKRNIGGKFPVKRTSRFA